LQIGGALKEGCIDEQEFSDQVSAAIGDLWYSDEASSRETLAVMSIDP
jgi:hypothetical protein